MRTRNRTLLLIGLLVSLGLAGIVSYYASSSPDGLERVADDEGFLSTATEHATAQWPLADYSVAGIGNGRLAGGLAGVIGVLIVLALAGGLFFLLGRGHRERAGAERP